MSEPWIETQSGVRFEFNKPDPSQVSIMDIAYGLSKNCRFVGQCRKFYSVAEHSFNVARMLHQFPVEIQLAGLLHDASEAYITDVASPVKEHITGYQAMEDNIMKAIARKFHFEYPLHPAVKQADRAMLSNEAWHLLPSQGKDWTMWGNRRAPVLKEYRPVCMDPDQAAAVFLEAYGNLMWQLEEKGSNKDDI